MNPIMNAHAFRHEADLLAFSCLAEIETLDDWTSRRGEYHRQFLEMLGLDPLPERTDLKPVVTGRVEHPEFGVENLHFQSLPGLYVTGNLYLPRNPSGPAPGVLYACGHSQPNRIDGIAYGAKVHYQHHGAWLARNGYVCLVVDTLQLGEIEGLHHGTYREGRWEWNARGYTPAGVEAWNGIRALDYLQSRPGVDGDRLGVTGRSGGGATSWWVAAADERVRAAVPVAGMTDLEDQVVRGCIEDHCDCMFMLNAYRWDFPQVAALVAPRALLIGNTDKDPLFPLEGVVRLHDKVRRIYQLYGAGDRLGLLLTEGKHEDTQELQIAALRWFDRHLKGEERRIETAAVPFFTPAQLKVFETIPPDERNTRIDETFVPEAPFPPPPETPETWERQRETWMSGLREKVFRGWPAEPEPLETEVVLLAEREAGSLRALEFTAQPGIRLRLHLIVPTGRPLEGVRLNILDDPSWVGADEGASLELPAANWGANEEAYFGTLLARTGAPSEALAWVAPRGVRTEERGGKRSRTHLRRRYMLLGQTLAGMRVWDVRRAIQALSTLPEMEGLPLHLQGEQGAAVIALYASLFEPGIAEVTLHDPPRSHREGPDLLNVLHVLDMPQAIALAAERTRIRLLSPFPEAWSYAREVARNLSWSPDRLITPKGGLYTDKGPYHE